MPSLQSWQEAISPSDLYFNSSTIQLRNHHYPPGGLNTSNFANSSKGMGEMTIAAERWYKVGLEITTNLLINLKSCRCLTKPILWQIFPLGAIQHKFSRLTSTNQKYSSIGVEAASLTDS